MRERTTSHLRRISASAMLALCASGLGAASCEQPNVVDLIPPRVVQVSPVGPLVTVDASFEITFSEPMGTERLLEEPDFIVLALAAEVTEQFESDIRNPPLIDSRHDDLIPTTLSFDDTGTQATLTPLNTLRPGTAYAVVVSADVRDLTGNPIVGIDGQKANFVYAVSTDAGPPEVITTSASGVVPPNQKRFWITFNQPVQGVSTDSVSIVADGAATTPGIESIEILPSRDEAVVIVETPDAGCERLTPSSEYHLQVNPGIRDDAGREMPSQSFSFSTGGACDLTQNQLLGADFIGLERGALLLFATSKASTTEMWFGARDGPLDCLGGPCPLVGAAAREESDGYYLHEIRIEDVLELGETYAVEVRAEDDVGSVVAATGTVITTVVADVAVNEILPNPSTDEVEGEFVELVNFGSDPVDLGGFGLQVGDKEPCTFPSDGTAPVIAPGGYVVVARSEFVAANFPALDPADVYNPDGTAGCAASALTLSNAVQAVSLYDERGRAVSVYPGYPALNPTNSHEGQSIERVAPDAPDIEASFCFGSGPPSPGNDNSAFTSGCDE